MDREVKRSRIPIVKRIVDWLAASFKKYEGIDLLKDKQALQRLTKTTEKAKMELSTLTQANRTTIKEHLLEEHGAKMEKMKWKRLKMKLVL
ncbi:stromal 70 kDa heat shock-related protein, chloroplastic-like protein [Tanacetum coccineum]